MNRKLSCKLLAVAALAAATLAASAQAGDAKGDKHVWTVPINVSQALKIKLETKATPKLLKKVSAQCLDDDCQKQVAECRKVIKTCVLMPSKESVHESEVENN